MHAHNLSLKRWIEKTSTAAFDKQGPLKGQQWTEKREDDEMEGI